MVTTKVPMTLNEIEALCILVTLLPETHELRQRLTPVVAPLGIMYIVTTGNDLAAKYDDFVPLVPSATPTSKEDDECDCEVCAEERITPIDLRSF